MITASCFINLVGRKIGFIRLPSISRKFIVLPKIGESVSLFPDGITQTVTDVEHNFDGTISLVFEIHEPIVEYFKESVKIYPDNY